MAGIGGDNAEETAEPGGDGVIAALILQAASLQILRGEAAGGEGQLFREVHGPAAGLLLEEVKGIELVLLELQRFQHHNDLILPQFRL